jgi:calcium-translocating P-type ATPase
MPDQLTIRETHALDAQEVLSQLASSPQGLSNAEVEIRRQTFGANILPRGKVAGPLEILWSQINNPLIWVLIGSGLVAMFADPDEGIKNGMVILGVVVFNTIIGFVQEFRAGKAIQALSQLVPENTNVLRGGELISLLAADLVPGDIVQLASGDKVPADMRLIRCKSLRVEEAALTGESVPTEKSVQSVKIQAALGDRLCMVFGGTLVTYGSATGVVTTIGSSTELGKINDLLNSAANLETPLTQSLKTIGKSITIGIVILSAVILLVGTYRMMSELGLAIGEAFRETLIFSIALAVGAIPEGLPAIVTIALAVGVQRMADRRAVVRKLPSVETLGSTTVICSDKTGTLTKNEMTVTELRTTDLKKFHVSGVGYDKHGEITESGSWPQNSTELISLIQAGVLCNDASIDWQGAKPHLTGDPTELALLVAGEKAGIQRTLCLQRMPRVDTLPFESENQFMATVHRQDPGFLVFLKGAPEVVLRRCADVSVDRQREILAAVSDSASRGLRVLAFAERLDSERRGEISLADLETGFKFLGLQAMIDPPRQEAIESIRLCHQAGIVVKMITGDHPETAEAIGRQIGIIKSDQHALTGVDLARLPSLELRQAVVKTNVFARVAPEHKLKLVKALQELGEVAAMTGDGVNDAPALKQSNIGIAMGITGTSVSKEAADIVLADDNFSTIAAAVEEGRRVYDNLIKSLAFVLPTNLGLALILIYAVLFFPFVAAELLVPILPTQILWINLVGTVALALPLAFEAKERDVMKRPPRKQQEPLLSGFVVFRTAIAAILMAGGAISLFNFEHQSALDRGVEFQVALAKAQTMAVTTVVFFQVFYMFNCRSLKESIFHIGLFSNTKVFVGLIAIIVLQALFIFWGPMQIIFNTQSLSVKDLALSAAVGASIIPIVSIEKLIRSRLSARPKLEPS